METNGHHQGCDCKGRSIITVPEDGVFTSAVPRPDVLLKIPHELLGITGAQRGSGNFTVADPNTQLVRSYAARIADPNDFASVWEHRIVPLIKRLLKESFKAKVSTYQEKFRQSVHIIIFITLKQLLSGEEQAEIRGKLMNGIPESFSDIKVEFLTGNVEEIGYCRMKLRHGEERDGLGIELSLLDMPCDPNDTGSHGLLIRGISAEPENKMCASTLGSTACEVELHFFTVTYHSSENNAADSSARVPSWVTSEVPGLHCSGDDDKIHRVWTVRICVPLTGEYWTEDPGCQSEEKLVIGREWPSGPDARITQRSNHAVVGGCVCARDIDGGSNEGVRYMFADVKEAIGKELTLPTYIAGQGKFGSGQRSFLDYAEKGGHGDPWNVFSVGMSREERLRGSGLVYGAMRGTYPPAVVTSRQSAKYDEDQWTAMSVYASTACGLLHRVSPSSDSAPPTTPSLLYCSTASTSALEEEMGRQKAYPMAVGLPAGAETSSLFNFDFLE
ncbi:uncharacterized protein BCR38DRAFT_491219 [Pseudomassariella vexata]|uniref:Uncharacterized protein n=1 Tax=Pseudomassariella vexata TaxID=1141098 RepID=A0A1Y2D7S4_9PEZI|nr:uncharacterized protein BCR38DRAFT_491219 [Pseudomassariella vexata]ORY55309.1 hypothetical protein BCR38DRAFT_491219 [Pseudomassariella vexata]